MWLSSPYHIFRPVQEELKICKQGSTKEKGGPIAAICVKAIAGYVLFFLDRC